MNTSQTTIDTTWLTLEESIQQHVSSPLKEKLQEMIEDNRERFETAHGASNNHQAWRGGWYDHISEVCNNVRMLYALESQLRPLEFSLEDALVAAFVHDLEKPWKYKINDDGTVEYVLGHKTKQTDNDAREAKLAEYGIELTDQQRNGMLYAEGEFDYTNTQRRMQPIGALVHMADIASARLRHNYPLAENDEWSGAGRIERRKK